MHLLKKIPYTDLLLLGKLFCGEKSKISVYDPFHCVIDPEAEGYYDQEEKFYSEANDTVVFNFSYESLKRSVKSTFIFDFFLKSSDKQGLYYFINNPDGTIRWIYPASSKKPYFLELYNAGTLKGTVYKYLVKLAFSGGFRKQISSGSFFLQQKARNKVEEVLNTQVEDTYSIFTGTKGENRKSVISLHHNNDTTHFIKIAFSQKPQQLIQNEIHMLTSLSKYDFTALSLPQASGAIDPSYAKMTNIKPAMCISANRLRDIHLKALSELYLTNHETKKIKHTPAWSTISNQMALLDKEHDICNDLDDTLVYSIIHKLFILHNEINVDMEIPVSFAHGDFTPWNMYTDDHRLYVYDWELAGAGMPMFLDLFHFIFQSQILLFKNDFSAIAKNIQDALENKITMDMIGRYKIDTTLHYKLYLLFNISYYIRLYMNQKPLHIQAHWLINAWNRALNELKK